MKPKAKKETKTDIEVLNPSASSSSSAPAPASKDDNGGVAEEEEEENELPQMTPDLEAFARLPLWGFEASWEFIQNHRGVVVGGASDALLVAAFQAQTRGDAKYAKQAVHQSLLLQYGEKLGKDGLKLFFQRCVS